MTTAEQRAAFLAAITESEPGDFAAALTFADWLEERGDRLGDGVRRAVTVVKCDRWEVLQQIRFGYDGTVVYLHPSGLAWG